MQALQTALEVLRTRASGILGRELTETELHMFSKYLQLLRKWQKVQRLIGSAEPGWIVDRLFLDSLMFLQILPPEIESICDVGSGAGLPGIPMKIVKPDLHVTLIESRQRRVSFLSEAIRVLGLGNAAVLAIRVEDAPPSIRRSFEAAVLRCAGSVDEMVPVVSGLVAPGGLIVCSGPPERRPLSWGGEWREAHDPVGRKERLFAVFRV